MKISTAICLGLFFLGVALFLAQLWLQIWGVEMFSKIMITDAVLFGVSFVVAFLIRESNATKKVNNGSGLD